MNDTFSEIELRKLDLNLLLVFSAIMREGGVAPAAKRLYLGASAVSMALTRLREALQDDLFVRAGSGMTPTPRAEALWAEIEPALAVIETATRRERFDPATSTSVFRFGAPDDLEFILVPMLLTHLARHAPKTRLVVQPMDFHSLTDRLDDHSVDVALTALPGRRLEPRHRRSIVCEETFSALFDKRLVKADAPVSLAQFVETPHVLLSIRGDFEGPIDRTLAGYNKTRQVVSTVARFATIPFILRERPVLACVPTTAARFFADAFDLTTSPLPFSSPRFELALAWHARTEADPAQSWFRSLLEHTVRSLPRD
ncbi:MAG: LysR family transcriptional regulator [Pseudomonadota bacterium]